MKKKLKTKDLNIEDIIVPEGFKVIIDPEVLEEERKDQERQELEERIAIAPIPTDEELIEFAKMTHPYYEDIKRLESLM